MKPISFRPMTFQRLLTLARTLRFVAKGRKDITLGTLDAVGRDHARIPTIKTVFVPKGPRRTKTAAPRPRGRPRKSTTTSS